jgi:2-haloacid dehalogenase
MTARDPTAVAGVEALVFDVFGTVVDWRSTVIRELEAFGRERRLERDWAGCADRWRQGYIEGFLRIIAGQKPWQLVDEIHRDKLVLLLAELGVGAVAPDEIDSLNRVWHRLDPWPDSVAGLARLPSRYIVSTLSNGNVSLLVDMAKHAGLTWDCVLSAELAGRYKPDPEIYRWAARVLGLPPEKVAMVAAHAPDLEAAKREGLRTCYVSRPDEYGPGRPPAFPVRGDEFDVHASDLEDLAAQLADVG